MKKINSINFGAKMILTGLIFLIPLTLIFKILENITKNTLFFYIKGISFAIGIIIEVVFAIILIIELNQDRRINKNIPKTKNIKLQISKDRFECNNCGNRNLTKSATECNVCGIKFKNKE